MKSAYPLEALRTLRGEAVDAATRALADAVARVDAAAAREREAKDALARHRAETARLLEAEASRLLAGFRVEDPLYARAWSERRKREAEVLLERVRERERERREAEVALERAREALADARREQEAIESHHARWRDAKRRAAEAREEAEAEDRRSR